VVILSEAKDLLVIQINDLQILRRPWLLRMTALGEFFSNLLDKVPRGNHPFFAKEIPVTCAIRSTICGMSSSTVSRTICSTVA